MKLLALLFGALKLGKLLPAVLSMLLSIGVYALVFGWAYAVGFVVLLLVHEMGHFVAARRRGLNVGAPTFIPFVGAWIELKDMPHDAETEAYVGVAGPLAGTVGALACFYLARSTGGSLLLALAYSGFMLNFFNLKPLLPFDGGRITAAISPRLWLLGAPLLVATLLLEPEPASDPHGDPGAAERAQGLARTARSGRERLLRRACRDPGLLRRASPGPRGIPGHHVRAAACGAAADALRAAGAGLSRSSGLRTPLAPFCITCVYTIVVLRSECPRSSCSVRTS